jgi:hypothetical protein
VCFEAEKAERKYSKKPNSIENVWSLFQAQVEKIMQEELMSAIQNQI